ncbi:NAD(P)-binding protein [Westerdykella ornata]|uniref:NAD(P)-binding protein n=1 Tax=Westerdykella ornata TaxID=318751 RepID=A0A6A6JYI4_WESOR|nr:NAD(P)-binding protein [Westerdykella ornata]KAF2281284.1 NAD(P)-binding protein [Westerdykella ornata]
MAHPNRLKNAHILVFGGTSGIGFAVASLALSNNARVTISGSTQEKVDSKVALLRSIYPSLPAERVTGYALNLADTQNLEENLKEFFEKVTNGGQNKVNHVAFTAGDALRIASIPEITFDQIYPAFHVRFAAPVIIAKLLSTGKYMPQSPDSSLTLTAGVNVQKPRPGWAVVAASGAAIEGLARGLAVDLAPIRVNTVSPGAIDTELLRGATGNLGEDVKNDLWKRLTLTGRIGRPEDAAEAYAWFMRDGFATGTRAETNGGRLLKD